MGLTKFRCEEYWHESRQLFAYKSGRDNLSMRALLIKLLKLFLHQVKFATSGLVATMIDYALFLLLVHNLFAPVPSNVVSYSIAMVINFWLQKKFVFSLQGSASRTFIMSIMVSMGGLLLSTAIVFGLTQIPFYWKKPYLSKLIATSIVFFYNFYLKRYVFEK